MRLKNKVALITGAGMGQGRAACILWEAEVGHVPATGGVGEEGGGGGDGFYGCW